MAKQLSRAVQERRAPGAVTEAEEDPRRKRWRELDFFATPPWACRAGAELIMKIDPAGFSMWEPCAGDGIMAICFQDYFPMVVATDIEPQSERVAPGDFFADGWPANGKPNWIITNPPFARGQDFITLALERASRGVAVIQRLAFLESADRYPLHNKHLTTLAPFCERVGMQLGPWEPKCSTATSYAWFIYDKLGVPQEYPDARLIPPGTKARLSRPDDVRRFVKSSAGGLL